MKYRIKAYILNTNKTQIADECVSFAEIKAAFIQFSPYKETAPHIKITDKLVRDEWSYSMNSSPVKKRRAWELSVEEYNWILQQRYKKAMDSVLDKDI